MVFSTIFFFSVSVSAFAAEPLPIDDYNPDISLYEGDPDPEYWSNVGSVIGNLCVAAGITETAYTISNNIIRYSESGENMEWYNLFEKVDYETVPIYYADTESGTLKRAYDFDDVIGRNVQELYLDNTTNMANLQPLFEIVTASPHSSSHSSNLYDFPYPFNVSIGSSLASDAASSMNYSYNGASCISNGNPVSDRNYYAFAWSVPTVASHTGIILDPDTNTITIGLAMKLSEDSVLHCQNEVSDTSGWYLWNGTTFERRYSYQNNGCYYIRNNQYDVNNGLHYAYNIYTSGNAIFYVKHSDDSYDVIIVNNDIITSVYKNVYISDYDADLTNSSPETSSSSSSFSDFFSAVSSSISKVGDFAKTNPNTINTAYYNYSTSSKTDADYAAYIAALAAALEESSQTQQEVSKDVKGIAIAMSGVLSWLEKIWNILSKIPTSLAFIVTLIQNIFDHLKTWSFDTWFQDLINDILALPKNLKYQ